MFNCLRLPLYTYSKVVFRGYHTYNNRSKVNKKLEFIKSKNNN